MASITRHFGRCFVGGIVALLPIGGTVLTVVWLEKTLSESWLVDQPFYFPGLGLLLALAAVYLVGLIVTTFLGRWLWKRADLVLERLPALGSFYRTLKQILGYGHGDDAFFHEVVLLPSKDTGGEQLGLVTSKTETADKRILYVVFVPGSPNPTTGRLLMLDESDFTRVPMEVSDALKALVSVGKTPLPVHTA